MLRFKSTYILFAVFLGLLALVVLYANDGSVRKRIDSDLSKPLFTTSQINQMTEVSFTKAEQTPIILTKDDAGVWNIDGTLVDPDEGSLLTKTLLELPTGRRVSKNMESWEGYGLNEPTADQVILKQGDDVLATLYLGSAGPSYPGFYMRRAGSDEVFLVSSNVQQLASYDGGRWKDKRLFVLDQDKINTISVRIAEERWVFNRVDGVWNVVSETESTPVEPNNFKKFLDDLISLKGDALETNTSLFVTADNAIAFNMDDGREYIVSIDKKDDSVSYALVTDRTGLLRLSNDLSARLRPIFLDAKQDEDVKSEMVE